MINFATIGTSWITEAYIRGCLLLKDKFRLSAVYSRDYNKGLEFGRQFGCDNVFVDLEQLAADPTIQAVYVASPNAFHYAQSKLMLENGKHVICEKPVTISSDELVECMQVAKETGKVFTIDQNRRTNKDFILMMEN